MANTVRPAINRSSASWICRSVRRVVDPRDETDHRRLAAARRSDEPNQLARLHLEAHASQNLSHAIVCERHVVELDASAYRREPHRVRHVLYLRLAVEHLEDAMRR